MRLMFKKKYNGMKKYLKGGIKYANNKYFYMYNRCIYPFMENYSIYRNVTIKPSCPWMADCVNNNVLVCALRCGCTSIRSIWNEEPH